MVKWFIDFVVEWSSAIGWIYFSISLIPIIAAHRALVKEELPSTPGGWWLRRCKFLLLWSITLIGFVATKSSEWSSGRLDESHKAATNRLAHAEANLHSATQQLAVVEKRTSVKPLPERLRMFLDSLDKGIVPHLATQPVAWTGYLDVNKFGILQGLLNEPGSERYITRQPQVNNIQQYEAGRITYGIRFIVTSNALEGIAPNPAAAPLKANPN